MTDSRDPIPHWMIGFVVVTTVLFWGGSIIWSTSHPDWPIPPSIHAGFIAVVTGLMGYLAVRGRKND